jgi:predicted Zn-ribbon and HTH transcriptional regulator
VRGDRVGAEEIDFVPGPVRSVDYFFDIGTAGATSLVLQTLLLPQALAPGTSNITIRGGTHVPWSPCFHYLDWQWRPFLARIGVPFDLTMTMAGFYPQGGGELQARIPGSARPRPLKLTERGPARSIRGLSAVANLPREIGVDGPLGGPATVRVQPGPAGQSELTKGNGGAMFRRDLIDILEARPITLHELALLLDERPRDLEDDLEHLFRSLRKGPLCPMITPASCRKCGFRFDEHKLHKPGKCPRCKGTWISEPLISLEEKR